MKKFYDIAKLVGFGLACGFLGAAIQEKRDMIVARHWLENLTRDIKGALENPERRRV